MGHNQDDQILANDLSYDLITQWGEKKNWLLTFYKLNFKLLSCHPHQTDFKSTLVTMNGCNLNEVP